MRAKYKEHDNGCNSCSRLVSPPSEVTQVNVNTFPNHTDRECGFHWEHPPGVEVCLCPSSHHDGIKYRGQNENAQQGSEA